MLGCGAATPPDHVHPPLLEELAHHVDHRLGRLVVAAERVRQPGVRVDEREGRRESGEFGHVGAELRRTECTVQADREELGVRDRGPEGLERLARERPPGGVGDGSGEHEWESSPERLERLLRGDDGRLGVERVEHGLDQQ